MRRPSLVIAALVSLSACSPEQSLVTETLSTDRSASVAATDAMAGSVPARVARGLAGAMREERIRVLLRDVMRQSPYTEHKVELRALFASPAGRELQTAIAKELQVSQGEMGRIIAALPALDLYLPSRLHRMTWQATPNVAVGVVLSHGAPGVAYEPSGATLALPLPGPDRATVLIGMAPPEPKGLRIDAQPDGPGSVVQDANDGEISGRIVRRGAGNAVEILELARFAHASRKPRGGARAGDDITIMLVPCDDFSCGGGAPAAPSDTTKLGVLEVLGVCDNSLFSGCGETNEFRFTSYYHATSTGPEVERMTLNLDGVPSDVRLIANLPMIFRIARFDAYIETDVWEDDGGLNPDDEFDPNPKIRAGDNGAQWAAGDLRCGYQNFWGNHDCNGGFFWREMNFTVGWR